MRKRDNVGFTVVELLIVIAVLGLLVTAVISVINPERQFQNARNAQRKKDLRQMAKAVDSYAATYGTYPSTGGQWCTTSHANPAVTSFKLCPSNPNFGLVPGDLTKLPEDPKPGIGNPNTGSAGCANAGYPSYLYRSDGINYKILAHCTPEGASAAQIFSSSDPFYDPNRPLHAWKISTPGANW